MGGGEDGGEDGGEGGEVCTCGKRYCKCPWYVAMSKEERRSLKQKGRDKKRPRSQKDQKNRGERSRRKGRHEQVAPPQSPPPGGTAPNSAVASPLLDQLRQAATRALGMQACRLYVHRHLDIKRAQWTYGVNPM